MAEVDSNLIKQFSASGKATTHYLTDRARKRRSHFAGALLSCVIPTPFGNDPSIAAFTVSGLRKANPSIIRTERSLQPSRFAI